MGVLGYLQSTILNRAPKFLRGPNLGRFLETVAFMLDTNVQTLAEGLKLSNPLLCDPSAFPSLSKDRKIRIFPYEPEASKRYRLSRWRQIRRHRGSAYGTMLDMQPYFFRDGVNGTIDKSMAPTIRVVHQSGDPGSGPIATWHTMAPDGSYSVYSPGTSNWDYNGHPEKWSRWWLIIYWPAGYADSVAWDDASTEWDNENIWDGVLDVIIADLVTLIVDSNPPHARCAGIIATYLQPDDDIPGHSGRKPFDPTDTAITDAAGWTSLPVGNWGAPVYLSGPNIGLASRPPWASWLYEDLT